MALRTLFEKFGMQRNEVFISTKQGLIVDDLFNKASSDLIFEELKVRSELRDEDFIKIDGERNQYYSLNPKVLNF